MLCEALETRKLFSTVGSPVGTIPALPGGGTVLFTLTGGTLNLRGTSGRDVMTVEASAIGVRVRGNTIAGTTLKSFDRSFSASRLRRIVIDGGGENDFITVRGGLPQPAAGPPQPAPRTKSSALSLSCPVSE